MASTIKYTSHLNKCLFEIDNTLQRNMQEAMKLARDEMKLTLSRTSGSGRVYKIKGFYHQSSAPSEPPAMLTGSLRNSIHYRTEKQVKTIKGTVFSDSDNAVYQEYGTKKQAPRPFFRSTLYRLQPKLIEILRRR